MFGFLKKTGSFLHRQAKTKTGAAAMTIIAGTVASSLGADADVTNNIIPSVVDAVAQPINGISLLAMLLRDKEAKREHAERQHAKLKAVSK